MRTPFIAFAAAAALLPAGAQATTLLYTDFSDTTGLQINGGAAAVTDGGGRDVLRVTNANFSQGGSVFSTTPITFSANYSFSTRFTFNFNNAGFGGADGLVFVIQPNANNVGGIGGGIGYQGIGNSLGVEFDNWFNSGVDINDNHIGINLNGNIASVSSIASPFALDSGQDYTAWIDYDGSTQTLEVRFGDSNARPLAALLSYNVDLAAVVGNPQAFVGFTSGTGAAYANHDVINWEFRDTFAPITGVPEPTTWAMLILGFGLLGGAMRRRTARSALVRSRLAYS